MPNTTNFNWPTPADTDLVKDGAAAIRNLGNGIDTSLIDLKGGTTGQILSKASNADMDFTFITPNVGDITEVQAGVGISIASGTGPIPVITNSSTDLITTAGDLLYGTAADTMARLGIGTAGQVLKVNSGATAPEWGAAATSPYLSYTELTTSQSTTSTSYVDINASATITFTAPASGKVLLQAEFTGGVSGGNQDFYFAWRDNSTSATIVERVMAGQISDNTDTRQRVGAIKTGLTAGTSYTYKISIKSGNATYTVRTLGVHLLLVSAVD